MDIRNEVLSRVYIALFALCGFALFIFARAVNISVVEGEKWRDLGDKLYLEYRPVQAERGNIIADKGELLASALPYFELRFDPNSTGMKQADFQNNVDSLAFCLANYVDNSRSHAEWKDFLWYHRKKGTRNITLVKKASSAYAKEIQKFPLFRKGQFAGGLVVERKSERQRPFKMLANRTIGYVRDNAQPVGLEGYFDKVLSGSEGKRLMQRVKKEYIPVTDIAQIAPVAGKDIRTTLNVNFQDIAQTELVKGLKFHNADYGCAIVMEVQTGAIKAIANIDNKEGALWESYNHAVGTAVEPGSTFKLASIISLLEDRKIELSDLINIENGSTTFFNEEMIDATQACHKLDTTTIRRAFELSSNVGIAKLVQHYYGRDKKAGEFIGRLKKMGIGQKTGITILGEAQPYLKEAYSKKDNWSGISLPWMSIGYESTMTPLQMLTFYNAVANGGKMMKPFLVSQVEEFGKPVEVFKPTVLNDKIASARTIQLAQELLLAVVENGTASKLKSNRVQFAGKTGTAQTNYSRLDKSNSLKYRASFAGYFPADSPRYSIYVMVENPKVNGFYGSQVAGPIFKNIAEGIFESEMDLHVALNEKGIPRRVSTKMKGKQVGVRADFENIFEELNIPYRKETIENKWVQLHPEKEEMSFYPKIYSQELVPNVIGLGLRDALHLLENRGLKVQTRGLGKVRKQSLKAGTAVRGQTILLALR